MVYHPPIAPLVWVLNILCKSLSFPCLPPFSTPQIAFDSSQDVASFPYLSRSGRETNFFDLGAAPEKNLVKTGSGWVDGYYMTTSGGRMIGAWEGIKYGQAHRWESSTPAKGWKGVAQTKSPGPDCLQLNILEVMAIEGNEDCLFLNVYSPVISGNKRRALLPVIVYIHGGSFLFGAGRYAGPSYLLNEDIVFVTLNYRVGVLGFMSTGDGTLSGNWGLKDQTLALHWIRDNIASFGGDPNRVTLMGSSAGGACVHLHMMSKLSVGLFSGGISLSGTAFNVWALQPRRKAQGFTIQLAKYFSCPNDDWNEEEMKWVPYPSVFFAPTLEPEDNRDNSTFLSKWPAELYKKQEVAPIPWITSVTEHEGLIGVLVLGDLGRWRQTKRNWFHVAQHVLDLEYLGLRNMSEVVGRITRYYLGNKSPMAGTSLEFSKMITDRYFHVPFVTGVQAHSQIGPTWAYVYAFDEDTRVGELLKRPKNWGASHGEDEQLFVNSSGCSPGLRRSDPEYKLSKMMVNLVTNFVWSGAPSFTPKEAPRTAESNSDRVWNRVRNPRKIELLLVDRESRMIIPRMERVRFWERLHLPDSKLWVSL